MRPRGRLPLSSVGGNFHRGTLVDQQGHLLLRKVIARESVPPIEHGPLFSEFTHTS